MSPSRQYLLRSAAIGTLIILLAGPIVGVCHFVYLGVSTGDSSHYLSALLLAMVATIGGGSGGIGYALVARSRPETNFWTYVALLAAMESYLLAISLILMTLAFVAPSTVQDTLIANPMFHLGLHAYGISLVTIASIVVFTASKWIRGR